MSLIFLRHGQFHVKTIMYNIKLTSELDLFYTLDDADPYLNAKHGYGYEKGGYGYDKPALGYAKPYAKERLTLCFFLNSLLSNMFSTVVLLQELILTSAYFNIEEPFEGLWVRPACLRPASLRPATLRCTRLRPLHPSASLRSQQSSCRLRVPGGLRSRLRRAHSLCGERLPLRLRLWSRLRRDCKPSLSRANMRNTKQTASASWIEILHWVFRI